MLLLLLLLLVLAASKMIVAGTKTVVVTTTVIVDKVDGGAVMILGVVNGTVAGLSATIAVGEYDGDADGGLVSPQLNPKNPVAQIQL